MQNFLDLWKTSAITTVGLFWMAFWAFGLGYLVSSMIQVFVTQEKMKNTMGESGVKSVALGTFFGFISSSCSFAALSTTRALFSKGAGLVPALAFLLASTNLVIELGIVISLFLSWQFVVGEYVGGLLLIVLMWIAIKLTLPKNLEKEARDLAQKKEGSEGSENESNWKALIRTKKGWLRVSEKYLMEWKMVWKDVSIGFTVAGIIATFVPKSFFETLFIGSGTTSPGFLEIVFQSAIGPVAAFFTFIGSMGNIPLAAVLFDNGVSFAGVMAFIFSDLVVFPVLRIQAKYYGWKMALYIMGVFLIILVSSSVLLHYGFAMFDMLPEIGEATKMTDRDFFKIDYSFFLNLLFIGLSSCSLLIFLKNRESSDSSTESKTSEIFLFWISMASYLWLSVGLALSLV